jgi:hypothetical protein
MITSLKEFIRDARAVGHKTHLKFRSRRTYKHTKVPKVSQFAPFSAGGRPSASRAPQWHYAEIDEGARVWLSKCQKLRARGLPREGFCGGYIGGWTWSRSVPGDSCARTRSLRARVPCRNAVRAYGLTASVDNTVTTLASWLPGSS